MHIVRKCKVANYVDKETQEWNTDLIETKKLENYTCQVAQDLYKGEAQHEPRGAALQISTRKCLEGLRTQSLAREREPRILDGTNCDESL